MTVLARYAKLPEKEGLVNFPDLKEKFWANKYINPARDGGLLKYLEGRTFEPTREFSRAEASEVLYRTPQIVKMVKDYWDLGATPQTGTIPEWMIKLIGAPQVTTTESTIETVEEVVTEEATAPEVKAKPKKLPVKKPKATKTPTKETGAR